MTARITIGGHRDRGRSAPPPEPPSAAERAVVAQLEDRIPTVIVTQRRRQTALNREAQAKAAAERA